MQSLFIVHAYLYGGIWMKTSRFALALMLLAALALSSCAPKAAKKITFASDATFPPMEFVDAQKNVTGFDVDLVAAIAKAGGFEATVKNTAWDGIFAGLTAGDYEAVASSVTITDERKGTMDFSAPYVNAGQVIIAPKATTNIAKPADLVGKKVGVQIGTTGDIEVAKIAGVKEKKTYDEIGLAVEDLTIGRLDAVVVDSPIAANYVLQNEKYKAKLQIVGTPFTEEYYGIAVKKGNARVLDLVNKGLAAIQKDGTLDKLKAKWLQ
jgi:polar amino acid transport system substrate-binding protein